MCEMSFRNYPASDSFLCLLECSSFKVKSWIICANRVKDEITSSACSSDKLRPESSLNFSSVSGSHLGLTNSFFFLIVIGLFLKKNRSTRDSNPSWLEITLLQKDEKTDWKVLGKNKALKYNNLRAI